MNEQKEVKVTDEMAEEVQNDIATGIKQRLELLQKETGAVVRLIEVEMIDVTSLGSPAEEFTVDVKIKL